MYKFVIIIASNSASQRWPADNARMHPLAVGCMRTMTPSRGYVTAAALLHISLSIFNPVTISTSTLAYELLYLKYHIKTPTITLYIVQMV